MDKNRIDINWARQKAVDYPAALALLETKGSYVPDALKDNGNTRTSKSSSVLDHMQALKVVSGCAALVHGHLDFPQLRGSRLYSKRTIERAEKIMKAHMRDHNISAFIWKLERGRNGQFHAEIVIPADSDLSNIVSPTIIEGKEDEEDLAKYLVKPADACACGRRQKERNVWTDDQLDEQRLKAVEEFARYQNKHRKGVERLQFLRYVGLKKSLQYPTC